MKTTDRASGTLSASPPGRFQKRTAAGFGCPACDYKGWNAFVATGLNSERRVEAWFWCPSCHAEVLLMRLAWLWLGSRILLIQIVGFAALYAVVMLVQAQPVPWIILIAASLIAVCILISFTMVLRSPDSYISKVADQS